MRNDNPHYGGNGNVPFPHPPVRISNSERRPGVLNRGKGAVGQCQHCGTRTWLDTDGNGRVVDYKLHTRQRHICNH